MIDSAPTPSDERLVDPDPDWDTDHEPFHYGLRTLFLIILIAAAFLSAAVPFFRWLTSRPGQTITKQDYWTNEIHEVIEKLGQDALKDLQVWHLYGGWFGCDHVWQAKATPEAVKHLKQVAKMKPVTLSQVPMEFWNMPRDWSEMPSWWKPKPADNAEYYMSPTFVPRSVVNNNLDCVAMYDPNQQMLYVWSQWDF